jgi:hypothetical protein
MPVVSARPELIRVVVISVATQAVAATSTAMPAAMVRVVAAATATVEATATAMGTVRADRPVAAPADC